MLVEMDGRESTSSSRSDDEEETSGMMNDEDADELSMLDEDMLDMMVSRYVAPPVQEWKRLAKRSTGLG
jgi:hypothetical protein